MTDTYQKMKFLTARDLLKRAGAGVGMKMFEYMRNTMGLIPPPIRKSRGKGAIGLYPVSVLDLLRRIRSEQKRGFTLREIKDRLKERIEAAFQEAAFWRGGHATQSVQLQIEDFCLMKGDHPASSFKMGLETKSSTLMKKEAKAMKVELKGMFKSWSGDVNGLKEIREKISELESMTMRMKVFPRLAKEKK